jgi:hypothetical protein
MFMISLPGIAECDDCQNNINILFNRQNGELYRTDKKILIKIVGRWDTFCYRVQGFFSTTAFETQQANVKNVIYRTLENINPNKMSDEDLKDLSAKLARLSNKVFSREVFAKNILLYKRLEKLCQREEKIQLEIESKEKISGHLTEERAKETERYNQALVAVKVAMSLGVKLERLPFEEGSSGCYFARDIKNKVRLVFKPYDETPYRNPPALQQRIKLIFQRIFRIGRPSLNTDLVYLAEQSASTISSYMGVDTVPITRIETLESEAFYGRNKLKKGSCQLFRRGLKKLNAVYLAELATSNTTLDQHFSQKTREHYAIIAFVIGNQDASLGNFGCIGGESEEKDNEEREEGPLRLTSFDNGLSFPKREPLAGEHLSTRLMHGWAPLFTESEVFSEEAQNIIKSLKEKQDKIVKALTEEREEFLKEEAAGRDITLLREEETARMSALKARIEFLHLWAQNKKPIKALAAIKTQEDFTNAQVNFSVRNAET